MALDSQLPLALHRDVADPECAVQYAVRDPDGTITAYGDQSYVAYGEVLKDHPDGVIVRRTIWLRYGRWDDAQPDETPEQRIAEVA